MFCLADYGRKVSPFVVTKQMLKVTVGFTQLAIQCFELELSTNCRQFHVADFFARHHTNTSNTINVTNV